MEETLTLSRVIENINYVYGEKLVEAMLLLVLLETVALIVIYKKKPEWIKILKIGILVFSTLIGITLLSRSKIQEGYEKLRLNDTTCAFQEIYDAHGPDHMTWADTIIYEQHYYLTYGEKIEGYEDYDLSVVCDESLSRDFLQILACVIVFTLGFLITRAAFKGENELLAASLAAPVGAATLVVMTLLFIIFHIPYNGVSVGLFLLVTAALFIWYSLKTKLSVNKYTVIAETLGIMFVVTATFLKFYKLAGDARWQMLYARDLVTYHYLQEAFYQVATYGFLGTSLHAFGILLGGDMFYAYFTIIGISAIFIIIAANLVLVKDEKEKWLSFVFLGIGLFFLISNFDYLYYLEWLLSNCAVGVCILGIAVLTHLNLCKGKDVTLLISILSLVVITTRIEGVCYVVLLLSVPFVRKGSLKKTNIIVGCEIIIWQIIQFILTTGVGQDGWTPTTGIALVMAGAILIAEPFLNRIRFVEKVMKHYSFIYLILLLAIIIFGFLYDSNMASDNFTVFVSHFSVSKNSNSLAFWGFILVLLPLAVSNAIYERNSFLLIFGFYVLMVFGISIFRTGNPLHTGTSDSFRRVLSQIMPLAIWLVSDNAGKCRK